MWQKSLHIKIILLVPIVLLLFSFASSVFAASPSAPSGLTATAISATQINLSWTDNSNNETGFKIERKEGVSGIYSQIAIVGTNVATYPDKGLTPGTTYYSIG